MIRRLFIFFTCCVVLSSCKKSGTNNCSYTTSNLVVPASEMTNLQSFVAANHPTATLHSGGFYYEILTAGTGTITPTVCSKVSVKYAGQLTNGFKFTSPDEENIGGTYTLGGLILGWQRGVPLIKTGGTIKLYLPPSLGYGNNTVGTIPPNSITIFTIQLIGVQ